MDFSRLAALAGGHAEARAVQVALKLGMFEALAAGPLDPAALASAINCDPEATALLGNAMAALELIIKRDGRLDLPEASRRFLLKASDEYLGDFILFDETVFADWANLEKLVRSGNRRDNPEMYQARPEETRSF